MDQDRHLGGTLKYLNLEEYFPNKLQLHQVLTLTEINSSSSDLTGIELIKLLFKCRYQTLFACDGAITTELKMANKASKFFASANTTSQPKESTYASVVKINPLDKIMAILLCSDKILQQAFIMELIQCRFAIPLMIPAISNYSKENLLIEWASRRVFLSYKDKISGRLMNSYLFDVPIKMVSLIRLGKCQFPQFSKSELASNLLSDEHHPYFLNRTAIQAGQKHLSEGMVDMYWYIPSYESDMDLYNDTILMLNLHGNVVNFNEGLKLIAKISHILLILIENTEGENDFIRRISILKTIIEYASQAQFLLICNFNNDGMSKKFGNFIAENEKMLGNSEFLLNQEIELLAVKKFLREKLDKIKQTSTLSQLVTSYKTDSMHFEVVPILEQSKELVNRFTKDKKSKILPLQETSKELVVLTKRQKRCENVRDNNTYKYLDEIGQKQEEIRNLRNKIVSTILKLNE